MPSSCCAIGCAKRFSKEKGVKLYRFPVDPDLRSRWVQAVRRENWQPNVHSRICGDHFISGRPAKDRHDPDYVPTIFRSLVEVRRQLSNGCHHSSDRSSLDKGVSCHPDMKDECVLTDTNFNSCEGLELKIMELEEKNSTLVKAVKHFSSPAASLVDKDGLTLFYTGIPTYQMFDSLLSMLLPLVKPYNCLSAEDQFLLVLMKLQLSVPMQDLACRFHISVSQVSAIFHKWLDVLSRELQQLIVWPDRGVLLKHLPESFKSNYSRTTCIIDCSEVFIERSSSLSARAETYSNYKSHNTVKFLVAVSPTGAVVYVSKCWGGRVSDRHLTAHCGFLEKLTYGDLVLADRGFDISDDLALVGAALAIPPFTRGKSQLSQREVNTARQLSRVRIHVERAIGRIKHFKILQSTVPINLLKRQHETDYTTYYR